MTRTDDWTVLRLARSLLYIYCGVCVPNLISTRKTGRHHHVETCTPKEAYVLHVCSLSRTSLPAACFHRSFQKSGKMNGREEEDNKTKDLFPYINKATIPLHVRLPSLASCCRGNFDGPSIDLKTVHVSSNTSPCLSVISGSFINGQLNRPSLLTHCLLYVSFPCSSHPCVSGSISNCCSAEPGSHLVPQRQTPASKERSSRRECSNTIPGKGRRTSRKVCCCHHKAFHGFTFDLVCAVHIPRACAYVPTLGCPVCNGSSSNPSLLPLLFPTGRTGRYDRWPKRKARRARQRAKKLLPTKAWPVNLHIGSTYLQCADGVLQLTNDAPRHSHFRGARCPHWFLYCVLTCARN